jgi:hypothetical protein
MPWMNPWLLLAALSAILASFGTGYYKGASDTKATQSETELLIIRASQAAQQAAAEEISKIKIKNTTIKREVHREIQNVPVYGDCKHTEPGLRLINQALTAGDTAGGLKLPSNPGGAQR